MKQICKKNMHLRDTQIIIRSMLGTVSDDLNSL